MSDTSMEIRHKQRFAFGNNWRSFLDVVDETRIQEAEHSLRDMLGVNNLGGRRFLDAGSGSGLFSLAARRLGAEVVSFDCDSASVAATRALRDRTRANDGLWQVGEGSVLDPEYLSGLGQFDVVYSWGVLHHTGALWEALGNLVPLVGSRGRLYIAIYNDQGLASRGWAAVKRRYNSSGAIGRRALVEAVGAYFGSRHLLGRAVRRPGKIASRTRAMSRRHDLVDWVGGWPFEVAKPEAVFDFLRPKGFVLDRLLTCGGGHGCNEYVFSRDR